MKTANDIKAFLKNVADNTIIPGQRYDIRIDVNDGGFNSYVALTVSDETWNRKFPVTQDIKLHRNTNNAKDQPLAWEFRLGGVCNVYADNPDIAMYFGSYGKGQEIAAAEAEPFLGKLIERLKAEVKLQRKEIVKNKASEKAALLAKLKELDQVGDDVE